MPHHLLEKRWAAESLKPGRSNKLTRFKGSQLRKPDTCSAGSPREADAPKFSPGLQPRPASATAHPHRAHHSACKIATLHPTLFYERRRSRVLHVIAAILRKSGVKLGLGVSRRQSFALLALKRDRKTCYFSGMVCSSQC